METCPWRVHQVLLGFINNYGDLNSTATTNIYNKVHQGTCVGFKLDLGLCDDQSEHCWILYCMFNFSKDSNRHQTIPDRDQTIWIKTQFGVLSEYYNLIYYNQTLLKIFSGKDAHLPIWALSHSCLSLFFWNVILSSLQMTSHHLRHSFHSTLSSICSKHFFIWMSSHNLPESLFTYQCITNKMKLALLFVQQNFQPL